MICFPPLRAEGFVGSVKELSPCFRALRGVAAGAGDRGEQAPPSPWKIAAPKRFSKPRVSEPRVFGLAWSDDGVPAAGEEPHALRGVA